MEKEVSVDIDQGIHKGKMRVALNEKRKKLYGFSFSINIANFEAFFSGFKLTKNPLFLKSDVVDYIRRRIVLHLFLFPIYILQLSSAERRNRVQISILKIARVLLCVCILSFLHSMHTYTYIYIYLLIFSFQLL